MDELWYMTSIWSGVAVYSVNVDPHLSSLVLRLAFIPNTISLLLLPVVALMGVDLLPKAVADNQPVVIAWIFVEGLLILAYIADYNC